MRNMLLVGALIVLMSCKSKVDQAMSDLSSLKEKMCACKDKDCAEGVEKDFEEVGKKYKGDKSEEPSADDKKKLKDLMGEYRDCRRKARRGGAEAKSAEALKKMTAMKDDMCACKDKACADKVNDEMTKWGQEQAKAVGGEDSAPAPEDVKKMGDVTKAYGDCMMTAMK